MYEWIKPRRPKAVDAGIQSVIEDARHVFLMLEDASLQIEQIAKHDSAFARSMRDVLNLLDGARTKIAQQISGLERFDDRFASRRAADNVRFRQFRQGDQE